MPVFLFTDLEGSTTQWEQHPDAMKRVMARHDELLRGAVAAHGGQVVKLRGDGLHAAFHPDATECDPLGAALAIQRIVKEEPWNLATGGAVEELKVRVGLHAGPAETRAGDWFGPAVNRAARVCDAAWGGQILLSPEALQVGRVPPGALVTDHGLHVLKDLGEPLRLHELRHPDIAPHPFPPPKSLAGRPHNLPAQLNAFLGREAELAEVAKLLDDPACRLLTVLGPGGIGKSRLALQAAAAAIDRYPDGVFAAFLAPVAESAGLLPALAETLRLPGGGMASQPRERLAAYLKGRRLLLVLDNFEHLKKFSLDLLDLLQAAPQLKFLVTSRERLNLQGEWLYELAGMRITGRPEDSSAVQLFLQSARRVEPGFKLKPDDLDVLIKICDMVEGMPLALELAAGWVRMLSVKSIAQEIGQNLDFLSTKMQGVPDRQRSLRAVFDYSWGRLEGEERRVLLVISVFRGGFRDDAALKLSGCARIMLWSLADKSFLYKTPSGRLQVHELLRQFAEEKLNQIPKQRDQIRDRHCEYYSLFLSDRRLKLAEHRRKGAHPEVLPEIEEELDNVKAAWQCAVNRGKGKSAAKAFDALASFYEARDATA